MLLHDQNYWKCWFKKTVDLNCPYLLITPSAFPCNILWTIGIGAFGSWVISSSNDTQNSAVSMVFSEASLRVSTKCWRASAHLSRFSVVRIPKGCSAGFFATLEFNTYFKRFNSVFGCTILPEIKYYLSIFGWTKILWRNIPSLSKTLTAKICPCFITQMCVASVSLNMRSFPISGMRVAPNKPWY